MAILLQGANVKARCNDGPGDYEPIWQFPAAAVMCSFDESQIIDAQGLRRGHYVAITAVRQLNFWVFSAEFDVPTLRQISERGTNAL